MPWPRKIAHFGKGEGKMEQKPKSVMTLDEIKKLVERLKHYYVARADCREAAELIEAMYLAERANEFYVAIEDKINHEQ